LKHDISLSVNGRTYENEVDDRQLLVYHLRESLDLTGTHVGCVIGECGACSVLVDGELVKSCLQLAVQCDGRSVTTVEGLGEPGVLSAVQSAFVEEYGLQCGYCTPGMVMAAHALLGQNPDPTEEEVREALAGNLCMCTGYVQIVQAVLSAAQKLRSAT
jgi:carbon-monoxide dehydrogenase small subunit